MSDLCVRVISRLFFCAYHVQLNVNALQPTHNKQSFIMDNNYRLLVNNLKDQLAKYWYPPAYLFFFL